LFARTGQFDNGSIGNQYNTTRHSLWYIVRHPSNPFRWERQTPTWIIPTHFFGRGGGGTRHNNIPTICHLIKKRYHTSEDDFSTDLELMEAILVHKHGSWCCYKIGNRFHWKDEIRFDINVCGLCGCGTVVNQSFFLFRYLSSMMSLSLSLLLSPFLSFLVTVIHTGSCIFIFIFIFIFVGRLSLQLFSSSPALLHF